MCSAGVAVAFTATVITVPIWVVFLAWASFFFVGGGPAGWVRSVLSNLVGGGHRLRKPVCRPPPRRRAHPHRHRSRCRQRTDGAGLLDRNVLHHACGGGGLRIDGLDRRRDGTVGDGDEHLPPPGLVAAVACVLGATFGIVSEYLANVMTRTEPAAAAGRPDTEGATA